MRSNLPMSLDSMIIIFFNPKSQFLNSYKRGKGGGGGGKWQGAKEKYSINCFRVYLIF